MTTNQSEPGYIGALQIPGCTDIHVMATLTGPSAGTMVNAISISGAGILDYFPKADIRQPP